MHNSDPRPPRRLQPVARGQDKSPGDGDGSDHDLPLAGTTLLILSADGTELPTYRTWTADHGGLGLHVGSEFALVDWLDRNIFVRTAVLIDDTRLSTPAALALATEIRLLRPDVAVLLLVDEDTADLAPLPAGPSFAIDQRPLSASSFIRAIEVASLSARFDREFKHHLSSIAGPIPQPGPWDDEAPAARPATIGWILGFAFIGGLMVTAAAVALIAAAL